MDLFLAHIYEQMSANTKSPLFGAVIFCVSEGKENRPADCRPVMVGNQLRAMPSTLRTTPVI